MESCSQLHIKCQFSGCLVKVLTLTILKQRWIWNLTKVILSYQTQIQPTTQPVYLSSSYTL